MDLTATAFGLLVTVVGVLFTAVVLLVRRELDHGRDAVQALDDRLRRLEADHVFLRPLADRMQRKLNEAAKPIATEESHAVDP